MPGIAEREIEMMRAVQEDFLPSVCTVKRPVESINIAGSSTLTWTDVYTNLPCEVTPKVLRQIIEHEGGGQIQSAVRWNITMPYGTIIELNDRIHVQQSYSDESIYEVNGVQGEESYETATVAQCLKVE
jgi:hypothetical protein